MSGLALPLCIRHSSLHHGIHTGLDDRRIGYLPSCLAPVGAASIHLASDTLVWSTFARLHATRRVCRRHRSWRLTTPPCCTRHVKSNASSHPTEEPSSSPILAVVRYRLYPSAQPQVLNVTHSTASVTTPKAPVARRTSTPSNRLRMVAAAAPIARMAGWGRMSFSLVLPPLGALAKYRKAWFPA